MKATNVLTVSVVGLMLLGSVTMLSYAQQNNQRNQQLQQQMQQQQQQEQQQKQQQQQQMQQQMQKQQMYMGEMAARMEKLKARLQVLTQTMNQEMEKKQVRVRHQYEMMQAFNQSLSAMVKDMEKTFRDCNALLNVDDFRGNESLEDTFRQISGQLGEVTSQIETTLTLLEQANGQLIEQAAGSEFK